MKKINYYRISFVKFNPRYISDFKIKKIKITNKVWNYGYPEIIDLITSYKFMFFEITIFNAGENNQNIQF